MNYISHLYSTLANFQETNQYVDLIIIVLVLLGGYFAKQYLTGLNWNMALKTLFVSTVAVVMYSLILKFSETVPPGYMKKAFLSYTIATSLYEVILKHVIEGLNLVWDNTMERFKNKSSTPGT